MASNAASISKNSFLKTIISHKISINEGEELRSMFQG